MKDSISIVYLYTDFGHHGPYLGQIESALMEIAPSVRVINLLSDAPSVNPRAASYLLAALVQQLPSGGNYLAVVDPGVGGKRKALMIESGERRYVGPDNGLLSFTWRSGDPAKVYSIEYPIEGIAASFHGRDLFAPALGRVIQYADYRNLEPIRTDKLVGNDWQDFLMEIIYIDHFGNAFTGLSGRQMDDDQVLIVNNTKLHYARTFCETEKGMPFWYRNSCNLIEIAVNQGNAAVDLELGIGTRFEVF